MKVAIVFSGNPKNMKGIMNYVHEKCKLMAQRQSESFSVDFYLIQQSYSRLLKIVHGLFSRRVIINVNNKKEGDCITIDGVSYKCLGVTYGLLDIILTTRIYKRFTPLRFCWRYNKLFKQYDVVSSHTYLAHDFALYLNRHNRTPYICTWHGSDINVTPQQSQRLLPHIRVIIENAKENIFVSEALLRESRRITEKGNKCVIYTGPSAVFKQYPKSEREKLREEYGVKDKKVVAFVGNLIPIKNVLTLPSIFSQISDSLGKENVEFWVLGDGNLETELKDKLTQSKVAFRMFGKVAPNDIPKYLNVVNLLMLISINEGLSLVTMEGIKCGCYVVGSNVGGIPEVIGKENAFDLGEQFVDNISERAVEVLKKGITPEGLPEKFSWDSAIEQEISLYGKILSRVI